MGFPACTLILAPSEKCGVSKRAIGDATGQHIRGLGIGPLISFPYRPDAVDVSVSNLTLRGCDVWPAGTAGKLLWGVGGEPAASFKALPMED